MDTTDLYDDEEKFLLGIILAISRKEHKKPSEIKDEWCLPDVVLVCQSYMAENLAMENLSKNINSQSNKDNS